MIIEGIKYHKLPRAKGIIAEIIPMITEIVDKRKFFLILDFPLQFGQIFSPYGHQ